MHIAIDLDGTITEADFTLAAFARAFRFHDHKVTVLTACFNGEPTHTEKMALLKKHGFTIGEEFDFLTIVEGNNLLERGLRKAEFCRNHKVDVIFEDCNIYIEEINRLSPNTVCWMIRQPERKP